MIKWHRMIALAAAFLWSLCSVLAEEVPELMEPVGVQMDTAIVYRGDIRNIEIYEGLVRPESVELYVTVSGKVDEVHVAVGQEVKKGDLLISLDQEAQEKKLEARKEALTRLERQAAFDEEMARLEMEILESQLNQLQHQGADAKTIALMELKIEEEQLNQALEKTLRDREIERCRGEVAGLEEDILAAVLRAPRDGRIYFSKSLIPGNSVKAYQPLLYLADETELTIESVFVSETSLRYATRIYALIDDRKIDLDPVEVDPKEYVSLILSGETVTSQFHPKNPDEPLEAGQAVLVCVVTREAKDVLLIPTNALYSDVSGKYVYLVEEGKRIKQPVKIGISMDWETQITEGLEEGSVVYVKE